MWTRNSADVCLTLLAGMDLQVQDPGRPSKGIVQLVKDIMAEDGVGGFFKGWWAQIVALGSSNFVYFYASCMLKVMITTRYYTCDCRRAVVVAFASPGTRAVRTQARWPTDREEDEPCSGRRCGSDKCFADYATVGSHDGAYHPANTWHQRRPSECSSLSVCASACVCRCNTGPRPCYCS